MNPYNPTTADEERERLVLLCALDRAAVRMRMAQAKTKPPFAPGPLARDVIQMTRLIPGPVGRWSRRFSFIGDLVEGFL